jgi:DNA-binding beta-propeller fold protein YncE
MYRGFLSGLFLFLVIASAQASPGRSAYVLHYTQDKSYLDRFDVDKDVITDEILIPEDSGYNNFVVDENGGCYIAEYRGSWDYGHGIYYYNPQNKKIELFVSLENIFGPRYMVLTKDQLIVEVKGNTTTRGQSGIIFIDRKTRKITRKIFLQDNNRSFPQANIDDIYFDGAKYLFLSSFYVERVSSEEITECHGDIYVIDIEKKEIAKIITVSREYKFVDGVVNVGDKIYVAALGKGEMDNNLHGGSHPLNFELLVFSFSTGKLTKKIKVSGHPWKLIYDQSVNKLYVQHMDDWAPRNTVEVIDPSTDKIIGRLNVPSQLMFSVVKPGKMYISVGAMMLTPSRTKPGLLVLDTATDKVVKRIYGDFKGISEKSFVQ